MSRRIKPKDKYVRILMKELLAQFGWSVVSFEFSSSDRI